MAKETKNQKIKGLLTGADLQAIGDLMGGLMDKQAAVLASKQDLKDEIAGLEKRTDVKFDDLKDYMNQGFESVMEGMDALSEKLAEKEKVKRMEIWIKEASAKLGVKYQA